MLAIAGLVGCQHATASDGVTLAAGWAPSRDDAVIVEGLPATAPNEINSGGSGPSRSLMMRRPQSLSRPFPSSVQTFRSSELNANETLPSVTGTLLSPDGLPVPTDMHFDLSDPIIHEGSLGCGPCMPNCCGNWSSCGPVPLCCLLPRPPLENLELFGGVQGFTGPLNRGAGGSFGFHEGFNWGLPFGNCLAWQWGAQATQSTFEGNAITTDDRNQAFVTGGFFRRVDCGLQGGLVVDYLHDESDYEADLMQLRGELSWLSACRHEFGSWFTIGVHEANNLQLRRPEFDDDAILFDTQQATVEANDLLAFFYRRHFACGGEGRFFGGFTANDQVLLGGDILLPINPCWSMRAGFLYVIPDSTESSPEPNFTEETWNVGVSLVWTPCRRSLCGPNYVRPLFNVADNGSFATRLVSEDNSN